MNNNNISQPTYVHWRILAILVFVSFVSYFIRGNLSIAAPTMIDDLNLSEMQWGWVMSAFPAGYALFQFPGGLLGDRFGPRKMLSIIALTWGVLIAVTGLMPSSGDESTTWILLALVTIQFIVGAFHAPLFPILNTSIRNWFPTGGWALPTGLTSSGLTIGLAVTASLLPWLMLQYGWRLSFLIMAPVSITAAGLWYWYSRDNPADHPAVNQAELDFIIAGSEENVTDVASSETGKPAWLRVLKNRNLLLLTLSYACMNFVFYLIFTWGFYYLVKIRGLDGQEAGFITSLQWLGAALGAMLGGWFCDKLCSKVGLRWGCRSPILVGMVASAILLYGLAAYPNPYVAASMLGLCFFFNQLTEGGYWSSSISIGGHHAGAAGGLMNTGANAMGFINAILLASVATAFGWDVAIGIGSVFALIGGGLILLVRADQQMA